MHAFYIRIDSFYISYAILLYPAIFFVLNIVTKKYGYHLALCSLFISSFAMIIFVCLSNLIFGIDINFMTILGLFFSSFVSQFINLVIYYYLLINTTMPSILLFTNYIFAIMISTFIYLIFSLNRILVDDFFIICMFEIFIQAIIALIFTLYDKELERDI